MIRGKSKLTESFKLTSEIHFSWKTGSYESGPKSVRPNTMAKCGNIRPGKWRRLQNLRRDTVGLKFAAKSRKGGACGRRFGCCRIRPRGRLKSISWNFWDMKRTGFIFRITGRSLTIPMIQNQWLKSRRWGELIFRQISTRLQLSGSPVRFAGLRMELKNIESRKTFLMFRCSCSSIWPWEEGGLVILTKAPFFRLISKSIMCRHGRKSNEFQYFLKF